MPGPPDKYTHFNTSGLTDAQIETQLNTLAASGYTGPIACVAHPDGSTTIFVGGYFTAP